MSERVRERERVAGIYIRAERSERGTGKMRTVSCDQGVSELVQTFSCTQYICAYVYLYLSYARNPALGRPLAAALQGARVSVQDGSGDFQEFPKTT